MQEKSTKADVLNHPHSTVTPEVGPCASEKNMAIHNDLYVNK